MKKLARLYFGLALVGLIVVAALLGPVLFAEDPQAMNLADRFLPPSALHPFGLDQNGSDVLSKVVYGARISLLVSFSVVGLSVFVGLLVGSWAGLKGGWFDLVLMRLVDMIYSFPGFLLALSLVAVLGPSVSNLILAMCLTGWTGYARLVRAEVLHLKEREYVQSARALGAHPVRQLVFHIWPNLASVLIVNATFGMAGAILTESGLSFLGLGAPLSTPTWGQLLDSGRKYLLEAPHISIFPGLALMCLVLGFNLLGDGLRDWLDPAS
jgi:peptide/nickel transport system permease protein